MYDHCTCVSIYTCTCREEILGKIREYNLYKEALLEQLKYGEVCSLMIQLQCIHIHEQSHA